MTFPRRNARVKLSFSKMPSSPPAALPTWLRPAILVLSAILLMACFSTEVTDSDSFWHLATGKYLVEHHQLPVPDPFSFTTYMGKPLPGEETVRAFNLTHEWLAQIVMYLAYATGGFGGLVLLRAFVMTAFCALVGLWAYRRSQSFYLALAAAFVTASIASYFTSDRPYQITYVLIVATILDSGIPALDVAAAAAVSVLGKLPRRILPGLCGVGRLLRGIVVAASARQARSR